MIAKTLWRQWRCPDTFHFVSNRSFCLTCAIRLSERCPYWERTSALLDIMHIISIFHRVYAIRTQVILKAPARLSHRVCGHQIQIIKWTELQMPLRSCNELCSTPPSKSFFFLSTVGRKKKNNFLEDFMRRPPPIFPTMELASNCENDKIWPPCSDGTLTWIDSGRQ